MAGFCNTPSFQLDRSPTFQHPEEKQAQLVAHFRTQYKLLVTFYQLIGDAICMAETDLLTKLFLQEGKKQGLDEELLQEVLSLLVRDQFIPQGKRSSVQAELERIVKLHLKGD